MLILVATFAFNEGDKIRRTLSRHPSPRPYELLVVDDGSTDGALDGIDPGIIVIRNPTNQGIGASMKIAFQYALDRGYETLVIQAGNDKDDPLEIPALLAPILAGDADIVQGSRFLRGGRHGNMPRYRVIATGMRGGKHERHGLAKRAMNLKGIAEKRCETDVFHANVAA